MYDNFINSVKSSIKHWYIPLIVGILFIVLSVVVYASPKSSILALSIFFALSFLFSGLFEIIFSVANRKQLSNWGWSLAFGIITYLIGMSLVANPALSLGVLALTIGFLLLFRSIAAISFALDIKKYGVKNWGILLAFGILGAIFSFMLIWNPAFAGLSMVVFISMSLLFTGLFSITLSIQLRKIHKKTKTISAKLKERYDDLMEDIREEWEDFID